MTLTARRHEADGRASEAVYSPCERYRYALTRTWDSNRRRLLYVMLNPSKATELANDPTIERCERRAIRLGYGSFRVVNLFALRETSPLKLKKSRSPEGPENLSQIQAALHWTDEVLAAWGVHGAHRAQGARYEALLRKSGKPLQTLGTTRDGHPRHPLYIAYDVRPTVWTSDNSR